jgi:hypothetical protein
MKALRLLFPILVVGLAACDSSSRPSSEDVLAIAAGYEFSSEAAAEILAPQAQLPGDPEVVQALADLWVQYYLLARAAAEDSTLSNIDVAPLVDRQVEGEMVAQLREQVIMVDTMIPEDALLARYEAELPGGKVRARHILLQFPEGASDAQVDSVRAQAADLRARIMGGEDFSTLARQYSQDTGTAPTGGDLGSFGKGEMVPPFEAAAFELDIGEVSEVVETAFGLHIIVMDERIIPPFEERREQFRMQLQSQLVMEAESTYVANLVEEADIEVQAETLESLKQVAADPAVDLSPRAMDRVMVQYNGGSFTLREFRSWLLTGPPTLPDQIEAASDEQLENLLTSLTQSELLVGEAVAEGIEVPTARRDSLSEGLLSGVKSIAQELGFFELTLEEGESLESAADRVVRDILVQVVQNGREVYPLQTVAFALKEQFEARIFPSGIAHTVSLIAEFRAPGAATAPAVQPTPPADPITPDTAGGEG